MLPAPFYGICTVMCSACLRDGDQHSAARIHAQVLADMSLGAKPDDAKAEIKDSRLIFDTAWRQLVAKHGARVRK